MSYLQQLALSPTALTLTRVCHVQTERKLSNIECIYWYVQPVMGGKLQTR